MSGPDERPRRRWLVKGRFTRWLLAGAAGVVTVAVAAVILVLLHEPHNVSHPDLSFTASTASTASVSPPPRASFSWPRYGLTLGRTRAFEGDASLHPPFQRGWTVGGNALLEFPPVISGSTLWYMDDNATVRAVDTATGRVLWQRRIGTLSAASPALDLAQHTLIVPTLSDTGRTPGHGRIVALSMGTGRVIWQRPVTPGSESSPLIVNNAVFYGDQAGAVVSANVRTGRVNWTFLASGAVKGGAAVQGNNLYFDDYGGHVYDINARTGHLIWQASANGGALGFSAGTFYTTPAVAFGRVYVGNTSGYVYSFAAGTGQLAWSYGTGAYVYASPAVADVPGLGPTVYLGSYNANFYAFNAQSGAPRWIHRDARADKISGSATIVNGVVYYSDMDRHLTTGLDARTGRTVFSFNDGAFTPVTADPGHLYLDGGYTLYEFLPRHHVADHPGTSTGRRMTPATRSVRVKPTSS